LQHVVNRRKAGHQTILIEHAEADEEQVSGFEAGAGIRQCPLIRANTGQRIAGGHGVFLIRATYFGVDHPEGSGIFDARNVVNSSGVLGRHHDLLQPIPDIVNGCLPVLCHLDLEPGGGRRRRGSRSSLRVADQGIHGFNQLRNTGFLLLDPVLPVWEGIFAGRVWIGHHRRRFPFRVVMLFLGS
jgi:hypothetical protein